VDVGEVEGNVQPTFTRLLDQPQRRFDKVSGYSGNRGLVALARVGLNPRTCIGWAGSAHHCMKSRRRLNCVSQSSQSQTERSVGMGKDASGPMLSRNNQSTTLLYVFSYTTNT